MTNTSMTLYGAPPTRALRPMWLLNELDLDCEIVPVNPLEPDGRETLLTVNPFGKAPVLVDGDVTNAESVAIMFHLAEAHGGKRFLPTDPRLRAQMYQWNLFLVTEIEQPLWRIALHTVIYPEQERSETEVELAKRDCRRFLAPLEGQLADRDTIVGGDTTLTDFNAAFTLDWADDEGLLDASPNCHRFLGRMYDRPAAPPHISEAFACLNAGEMAPRFRRELAAGRKTEKTRPDNG